ncbi:ABC transporter ATP-binding protein [Gynuella sunshinyii]|uniref:ABC-type multidrug transport system, ATPase component n=1 Tax=Gynuella sunshinyii YC6258 TaxID=1445510 RepID=A0A0C5VKY5_9GAMM|nr:ABC transporter ATP-binding protein [Gynuella sunshinyii]AJQ94971.1 ABC-type multidrug transport system, ATPase component [Gynuella sunshinyii YC6258]
MTAALSIQDLRKVYDNGFQALKGINLTVQSGDFFALLGPNGAGKSTTLGIVSSLVNKTSGEVSVYGYDLDNQRNQVKRNLGVVPQEFNFNHFEKVYDIVMQQAGYYGLTRKEAKSKVEKWLRQLDLWDKRSEPARALSGGMKRRLMIARALVHDPKLLILDEPTAGVDIEIRRTMWDFLRELNQQGTTIILTTHYLEEAESLCRNIAIINKGEIAVNTSAKELLLLLNKTTFVMDFKQPKQLPQAIIDQFSIRQSEPSLIEFDLEKEQSLNAVLAGVTAAGVEIASVRPKNNRLEEVFVDLIKKDGGSRA